LLFVAVLPVLCLFLCAQPPISTLFPYTTLFRSYLPAGSVIDATGDGDVAALAGAEFAMGRDSDGLMQPMTLFFRIGNVDDEAVEQYKREHPEELFPFESIVEEATSSGRYTLPRRGVQLFKTLEPGVWRI